MTKPNSWPKVSIIIPVFNSNKLPAYLVSSLNQLDYPPSKLQVILIEIQRSVSTPNLHLQTVHLPIAEVIGYSQAANLGIAKSHSELIFLINPDLKIDKSALNNLVLFLVNNPNRGIVGPKVFSLTQPSRLSGYDFPVDYFNSQLGIFRAINLSEYAKLSAPTEMKWISGSAMLFRRLIWQKCGGFDEKLFLYWEDADFCLRTKQLGAKIFLQPAAVVWHSGSQSVGPKNSIKTYYLTRNGSFFLNKYSRLSAKIILHLHNLMMILIKLIRLISQPSRRLESRLYLRALIDFYLDRSGQLKD